MDQDATFEIAVVRPAAGGLQQLQVGSYGFGRGFGELGTLSGPWPASSFSQFDLGGGVFGDALALWSREVDGTLRVEAAAGR